MTPAAFKSIARRIAGPYWKTKLGPMIGRSRWSVMEYSRGTREVPDTVAKLMALLDGGNKPPRRRRE